MKAKLYYVTNRRHLGEDQWAPQSYGPEPSGSGVENLRFGRVVLSYDQEVVQRHLERDCGFGQGDGNRLSKYLVERAAHADIRAFEEALEVTENDRTQPPDRFGSTTTLAALQEAMARGSDVLIFVHGFDVDWRKAVASALSLEFMLNRTEGKRGKGCPVHMAFGWKEDSMVVLLLRPDRRQLQCRRSWSSVSQVARLPCRSPATQA